MSDHPSIKNPMARSFPESEDILSEIFKRLPVQSLRRCMHVEKLWYYLIQTPDFVTLHFNYHKNRTIENKYLLFSLPSNRKRRISLRYDNEQCDEYYKIQIPLDVSLFSSNISWKIYGISNGLLCLSCLRLKRDSIVYLWNPAVRKIKKLPASPYSDIVRSCRVHLAFGYSAKSNDFKVVKFTIFGEGSSFTIDVYSLSCNSWENLVSYTCGDSPLPFKLSNNSVFVNDSAFWVGKKRVGDIAIIVQFNMEDKTIIQMILPEYRFFSAFIQSWGELLYVSAVDRNTFKTWVLKCRLTEEGDKYIIWDEKLSINLQGKYAWLPLGFTNDGQMILRKSEEFGYVSCDVNSESKEFVDLWPSIDSDCCADLRAETIFVFMESLVLLDDDK
ncbi:hypothetical protein POM88_021573 [Heracleum sosnowskyi]|uniref:F-box domain-containing protein n=1 Tax=Heracleum sosnowskyi TaxID=360622 RepID=A0AAD8MTY2_9APIA|nr:hypothetical protein POM88_021573 [Heracleum sosnowskyi]